VSSPSVALRSSATDQTITVHCREPGNDTAFWSKIPDPRLASPRLTGQVTVLCPQSRNSAASPDDRQLKFRRGPVDKPQYQSALIVGAGSGLSGSIARLFAREGMRISLAARQPDKLASLCRETGARAYACDAVDPG